MWVWGVVVKKQWRAFLFERHTFVSETVSSRYGIINVIFLYTNILLVYKCFFFTNWWENRYSSIGKRNIYIVNLLALSHYSRGVGRRNGWRSYGNPI